jgi:TolA-binding protein
LGALGDAYLEKGDETKALKQYQNAFNFSDNEMTAPIFLMKAGKLSESMGNHEKALEYYTRIKEKYPNTNEGRSVDKYIARVNTVLEK